MPDLTIPTTQNQQEIDYWRNKVRETIASAEASITTLTAAIAAVASVPAGTIFSYGGETPPTGYLECDGASLLRTSYAALFAAIGTRFGTADATHFNIPNGQGLFIRGWDNSAGVDPGAASRTASATGGETGDHVGTLQGQATKAPTTPFTAASGGAHQHTLEASPTAGGGTDGKFVPATGASVTYNTTSNGAHTHSVSGGDAETRPVNFCAMFIIKT